MTKDELETTLEMRDAELAVRDDALDAFRAEYGQLLEAHERLQVECKRIEEALAAATGWRVPYLRQMNDLRTENAELTVANDRLRADGGDERLLSAEKDAQIEKLRAALEIASDWVPEGTKGRAEIDAALRPT